MFLSPSCISCDNPTSVLWQGLPKVSDMDNVLSITAIRSLLDILSLNIRLHKVVDVGGTFLWDQSQEL